jgi:hypothetical protein
MAVTGKFYPQFFVSLLDKLIDFNSDTIKGALVTSSYTFNAAHNFFDDITNECAATGNYVAGGQSLGTCVVTATAADSWGTSRANTTAYGLGAVVRPATGNTYLYQASTAGTSAGSIPTYPTNVGGTVTDGSVVWTCVGQAIVSLDDDGTNLQWASSTITARGLVIYDDTAGASSTDPLIAFVDFGADVVSSGGPFDVTFSSVGIAAIFV